MRQRPVTTLFMLMSLDGKISTGTTDNMDVDRDFPNIIGVREGLHQYYEIEQTTDLWSLNSGRVQEKMGVNHKPLPERRSAVNFVVLDNSHLNAHGVNYFCALSRKFVLATSNPNHPAFSQKSDNMEILFYESMNLTVMLEDLREKYACERITIQTGATLNAEFLREGLFDYVDIVVAPALIGGIDTASLIGGTSLREPSELRKVGALELIDAQKLEDSYLRLRYKVRRGSDE